MRINSPGGVVGPTQEVHDAILRLRRAGKPVVASLGAVAASGGYYIAVAADQIYANPGTLTGSIGVIMQMANFEQLMKKVGVDYVVVKAGQFKDLGNPGRPMTPDERRVLQTLLDDVHGQFIGAVASGRKLEREDVVRFADGRVFSGQQAKDLKMVDALGGLEDAVLAAGKLAGLPSPPGRDPAETEVLVHGPAPQSVRRQRGRRAAPPLAPGVQDPPLSDGLRAPRAPGLRPCGLTPHYG